MRKFEKIFFSLIMVGMAYAAVSGFINCHEYYSWKENLVYIGMMLFFFWFLIVMTFSKPEVENKKEETEKKLED